MNKDKNVLRNEKGNVFFFILLGVILFAALSYMTAKGLSSQTSNMLTERQIELAVSEILGYAQNIEESINKLRRQNVSEGDICFSYTQFSALNNAAYNLVSTCGNNSYELFHPNGGGLAYRSVPDDWLDRSHISDQGYGEWMFTNKTAVAGLGSKPLTAVATLELIAHLNHLKESVCSAINKKLGIAGIPDNSNAFSPIAPVNSGFTSAGGQINVAALSGERTGCFRNTATWNSYIFYKVLIERD